MIDAVTLADTVSALVDSYEHAEPIATTDRHRNRRMRRVYVSRRPSLLAQLRDAVMPSRAAEDQAAAAAKVPGSVPPARLDAIDTLLAIEQGAARWCLSTRTGLRDDAEGNLYALVGTASSLDQDTLVVLVDEVRAWITRARVLTDWQTPAYRPHVQCPLCERRGLRIRLSARSGCCVECGAGWGPEQIVALAEYVRTATGSKGAA